ncbi:hypothetical protein Taro_049148 [Colocasia esculenta]|uniref:Uncharacterized protein n=1 Tax=Colocasia esculenta TaxID=4460 RepID=A0A843XA01_COLES|nr:hypothetical protein [Colocasia esculenta]
MINSLCGSLKSDPTSLEINSSSKRRPPSPAASVPESKAVASELDPVTRDPSSLPPVDGLRFDLDVGGEVQSPAGKTTLWEALLLHEQMDHPGGADFMISSPLRDFIMSSPRKDYMISPRRDMISSPRMEYMVSSPRMDDLVSSPRREHMVSSPRREFMIGSPRREYSVTSPRRECKLSSEKKDQFVMISSPRRSSVHPICCHISYGSVHGTYGQSLFVSSPPPCNPSLLGAGLSGAVAHSCYRGKPQSPLHKVYNCTSSPLYAHAEDDVGVLPCVDDHNRDAYTAYPAMKAPAGTDCLPEDFDVSSMLPSLPAMLDCLSVVPTSRLCGEAGDTTLVGLQMPEGGDLFHMNPFATAPLAQPHEGQSQQENGLDETLLAGISNKSELAETSSHGLLQPPVSAESEQTQEQDGGLQIVHLLLACAEAVAKDDHMSARRHLHHLNRVVSPLGDSMQRVAAFFTDALAARLAGAASRDRASPSSPPPFPSLAAHTIDVLKIYQILYQACPYIKFAHFTANQAIFEAFESEERVHIVDLDILQGYQWPDLMQALAARPGGPPFLRFTGVGSPLHAVQETGRHLAELAHSLRIPFEFHPVGERLEDLQPHMLQRRVGEALAVNSVCRLHRVAGAQLGALLGMIRDQAPSVFTVVEQEASHNGPYFLGRFLEALHYYSAIFDSLDATFPADSEERSKVETYVFGREIRNIVAYEGEERVDRHEKLDKWKRVMEGKGFKGVPLSAHAMALSEMLLGLYPCDGYRLKEKKGCLLLGWQDRPLLAASAWRC